jgi:hypothetical protein
MNNEPCPAFERRKRDAMKKDDEKICKACGHLFAKHKVEEKEKPVRKVLRLKFSGVFCVRTCN